MKVLLHANLFSKDGGVGKHVFYLGRGLEDAGISVEYLYGHDETGTHNTYLPRAHRNHITCDFFLTPLLFKKHISSKKYDIIHSHAQIAYDSTFMKRTDVITTLHCTDHGVYKEYQNEVRLGHLSADCQTRFYFNLMLRKEKLAHRKANDIISVSCGVSEEARTYFGRKSTVIPNGVDIEEFNPDRDPEGIRKEYGIGRDDILVLFVGQAEWRKGLYYLLQAFVGMQDDTKLLLVGLPEFRSSQKNIINAGFVSYQELLRIYAGSDIFCIPSLYEGMPLVLLEAMACGKACVVAKTNGTDILSDKSDAKLVEKRDISGLRKAIESLRGRNERERLGRGARRTAEQYRWEVMVRKTIEIYDRWYSS